MSAFIVKDQTINVVISKLKYDRNGEWIKKQILKVAGYDIETREGCQKLGNDMMNLNVKSVEQRYLKSQSAEYVFQCEPNYTKASALKALQCWIYQSCEGDCDQDSLYVLMEKIAYRWAMDLVADLPEYQRASWG